MTFPSWATRLQDVSLRYGRTLALDEVTLDIPARRIVGLVGPDGVGKSSLLALVAGARAVQSGRVETLGGDMSRSAHRQQVCPHIAYMPQGLGRNLYPSLSVEETLQFFGRLFGHDAAERRRRIDHLTASTGLAPFIERPAGKLSGGMKQKLGLCCALIHDPKFLILDEPTTGVDPLARSQFWHLVDSLRAEHPEMSVIVATAYMEEADRFDWIVAMDGGKVLASGRPKDIHDKTGTDSLEEAFIELLPQDRRSGHKPVVITPMDLSGSRELAIEAEGLTMRFGDFVAVDHVDFRICRGEIYGFLGSNGCGKSTTMKMLTGLLPASEGSARLFGQEIAPQDVITRRRVGYMSQAFSLYSELTVRQNLVLHARLFQVAEELIPARVDAMVSRFGLETVLDALPGQLPMGIRQRLSLAVALVHGPELLILDEPTSGVDPIARDIFWQQLIDLARQDGVTIFISTHFMNEAGRCDRISFMHAGRVLVSDTPAELIRKRGVGTLEEAFISYLEQAAGRGVAADRVAWPAQGSNQGDSAKFSRFSFGRAWSYALRETLELMRDPVRRTLALLGTAILMFIMGYGINMDVEDLSFSVLDRDQTTLSQNYAFNIAGSPYFVERPPLIDYEDIDRRMRSGELALAMEIPPGFARDMKRGLPVQIGAWVDGANPQRAETIQGYVQGMHQSWLADVAVHGTGAGSGALPVDIETRFRYNPDVKSLPAMVPAMIPILLLMIPAMLAALSVVREKEMGSIVNLYVTPVTRSEFLLGKQLPYVVLGMMNFLLMAALAATVFGVPIRGSFPALCLASLLYVAFATGFGLFASSFTRSQIAAIFLTVLGTILPAIQFAGLLQPVSSLEGAGAIVGQVYPAAHMLTISRGVFNKALGFHELHESFWALAASVPVMVAMAILSLKKQES